MGVSENDVYRLCAEEIESAEYIFLRCQARSVE